MSIGDMLVNQQDLNSEMKIIEDLDKVDDHRVQAALKRNCLTCGVKAGEECLPVTDFQRAVRGQWVHVTR